MAEEAARLLGFGNIEGAKKNLSSLPLTEKINKDLAKTSETAGKISSSLQSFVPKKLTPSFSTGAGLPISGQTTPSTMGLKTPSLGTLGNQNKPSSYSVISGDTLSKIASRYGTTASELARLNKIKDINKINIGQSLKLY